MVSIQKHLGDSALYPVHCMKSFQQVDYGLTSAELPSANLRIMTIVAHLEVP